MINKLLCALILLVASLSITTIAQEDFAYLRVMQLSFIPEESSIINVSIDDLPVFENVSFPFASPYIELAPGDHTLTASIVENADAMASTTITLQAHNRYTLIVEGDYSQDAVQFIIIDESHLPLDETGGVAIVVNLTPETVDYRVNGELLLSAIEPEQVALVALPIGELSTTATISGDSDNLIFEQDFGAVPDRILITVLRVSSNGDIQQLFAQSSRATIAEYLLSLEGAEAFADALRSQTAQALEQADDGAYTMFLPTGNAIEALGDAIPTNPAELETWVANHITLADLPPYDLVGTESLTMLSGNTVSLQFADTESGWWEIEGAPIWSDVRFADGVVYVIDGVIEM